MSTRRAAQSSTEHMRLNENESAELTTPSSLSPASYSSQIPSYASDPDLTPAQMRHDCCSASDHPWPSDIESPCLLDYRFASHTPPITKATLSEIDLDSLFTNLLLRHDLNFDPKIQYRPTIRGIKDGSGVTEALKYWNAIGFEVAGLFVAKGFSSVCGSSHCCCCTSLRGDKGSLQTRLMRLPSMFETVREILKDLLKDCLSIDEWLVIDTRLDIDLLVQELENDTCDLVALSDWLGALLRRFCSPERHHLVDLMVFEVHHGVRSANTTEVRNGLMRIFSILETMKLDFANLTIRSRRSAMVDNTTEFEQEDFLQRIAKGWDVSQARTWMTEKRRERRKSSGLHTLAASATSLVGTNSDTLPPTFTLDYIRLRILQDQYKDLIYQTACRWTFEEILDLLHWEKSIPQRSYDHLFARISAIISDDEIRCEPSRRTEVVALELVREAYTLCDIQRVPDPDDLEFATSNLVHASNPTTTVCMDLSRFLDEDLHDMVEEEVEAIKTLTPMSISNRYQPECSLQAPSRAMTQQTELLRVAQQICHISVLHWRVWGPILYDLPDEPCDD